MGNNCGNMVFTPAPSSIFSLSWNMKKDDRDVEKSCLIHASIGYIEVLIHETLPSGFRIFRCLRLYMVKGKDLPSLCFELLCFSSHLFTIVSLIFFAILLLLVFPRVPAFAFVLRCVFPWLASPDNTRVLDRRSFTRPSSESPHTKAMLHFFQRRQRKQSKQKRHVIPCARGAKCFFLDHVSVCRYTRKLTFSQTNKLLKLVKIAGST